jgi:hypothetical protein
MALVYVNRHERSEFEAMIQTKGLAPEDFEVADGVTDIAAPLGRTGGTSNIIVIKLVRTGVERRYTSGGLHDSWIKDVEQDQDIDGGKFGSPAAISYKFRVKMKDGTEKTTVVHERAPIPAARRDDGPLC